MAGFDKIKIHNLLVSAASEVLEKMYAHKLEAHYDDILSPCDVTASINFQGRYDGVFWMIIPKDLSHDLASKFLSMNKEDIDDMLVQDTMKEMVNMVGGSILNHLDRTVKFALSLPLVCIDDQARVELQKIPNSAHAFSFRVSGKPMKMVLLLQTPANK